MIITMMMLKLTSLAILLVTAIIGSNGDCEKPSLTRASGTHAKSKICSGELIFEDNFDTFDLKKWQHELTLSGGGNWEFQYYNNNRTNSFVDNGILHIKPTLLADETGEAFLSSGTLDLNGGAPADQCTNPSFYGCSRTGTPTNILNPIKSARLRTLESFSFTYGKVEIRAKTPSGDWLWPAIWMMPRWNQYSGWPASGEIDIMESRGNKNLVNKNGVNVGTQLVGSTLHWGPNSGNNRYPLTHFEKQNPAGFDSDFHLYQVEWTPDHITFSIDNSPIGTVTPPKGGFWELGGFENSGMENPWKRNTKMAPFDQEFYIILNLAVGGTVYFDDSDRNPDQKPWLNNSPTAMRDFWNGRGQWLKTWDQRSDNSDLQVDYVRVWAL